MAEVKENHERILDIVVEKDEVTWQSMIYELVKRENMNPWDVDVSKLSARYLHMLRKLKEMDFRISGKVILAAAILLKIKSQKLLNEDISELDRLMSPEEEMSADEFYDDLEHRPVAEEGIQPLLPRTPQPRKRKVSIYDLMLALNKALEVRDRRVLRGIPSVKVEVPQKKVDISKLIGAIYEKITSYFATASAKLTFSQLLSKDDKEEKVRTFIPLLHLANHDQRKIDLVQSEPFGEIEIVLRQDSASSAPITSNI